MNTFKINVLFCIILLLAVIGWSADNKPISVNDVPANIGKTVTVEGVVYRVMVSSKQNIIIYFTKVPKGFAAVIPHEHYSQVTAQHLDLLALQGKTVTLYGTIVNDSTYGPEMILDDPGAQLIIPEEATSQKYAAGIIPATDALKHTGEFCTVEGTVVKVGQSKAGTTYFLNFSNIKGGFTVVIFKSVGDALASANMNPKSFDGKKVQVKGNIINDPQYGLQIILDKSDNIKLVK